MVKLVVKWPDKNDFTKNMPEENIPLVKFKIIYPDSISVSRGETIFSKLYFKLFLEDKRPGKSLYCFGNKIGLTYFILRSLSKNILTFEKNHDIFNPS